MTSSNTSSNRKMRICYLAIKTAGVIVICFHSLLIIQQTGSVRMKTKDVYNLRGTI